MSAEVHLQIRDQIIQAAEQVIADVGMHNATTRAIAHRAGCAEGSIYRYFVDKHALFIEIAKRRFPTFLDLVAAFPERAGSGSVEGNLEELAVAAMEFYRAVLPMAAGMLTEHELLREQRRHFTESDSGPMKAFAELEDYVRREQELGRVSGKASPRHVARLVLGACFGQAFLIEMIGPDADVEADDVYAHGIVCNLMAGLAPAREAKPRGR